MEKIEQRKIDYIDNLLINNPDKAIKLSQKDFDNEPIFEPIDYHSEEEPNLSNIEEDFEAVLIDLNGLQEEIADITQKYSDLLSNAKEKLNEIDKDILDLDSKIQDINLLCGNLSEFDEAISLTDNDFTGDFYYKGGAFSAQMMEDYPIDYEIVSIAGNGYEGNSFVLTAEGVQADAIIDAKNNDNIRDGSLLTYYEYSRICSGEDEVVNNDYINYDDVPCQCVVHIKNENTKFSSLKINTEIPDLIISSVLIEDDFGSFVESLDDVILINQSSEENIDGVYSNGFIYFPFTNQAKITFTSDYSFSGEIINMDIGQLTNE